jgi:inner membrane protein
MVPRHREIMAGFGHIAVGLASGRMRAAPGRAWATMLACCALAMLPDADVIPLCFGLRDHGAVGHRGWMHTPFFAIAVGVLILLVGRWRRWSEPLRRGAIAALLVGSHCLLDAMAQQGRGIMIAWPLSQARFHLAWRPIPDAPVGWVAFFSHAGIRHLALELVYFLPFTFYALWPSRGPFVAAARRIGTAVTAAVLLAISILGRI